MAILAQGVDPAWPVREKVREPRVRLEPAPFLVEAKDPVARREERLSSDRVDIVEVQVGEPLGHAEALDLGSRLARGEGQAEDSGALGAGPEPPVRHLQQRPDVPGDAGDPALVHPAAPVPPEHDEAILKSDEDAAGRSPRGHQHGAGQFLPDRLGPVATDLEHPLVARDEQRLPDRKEVPRLRLDAGDRPEAGLGPRLQPEEPLSRSHPEASSVAVKGEDRTGESGPIVEAGQGRTHLHPCNTAVQAEPEPPVPIPGDRHHAVVWQPDGSVEATEPSARGIEEPEAPMHRPHREAAVVEPGRRIDELAPERLARLDRERPETTALRQGEPALPAADEDRSDGRGVRAFPGEHHVRLLSRERLAAGNRDQPSVNHLQDAALRPEDEGPAPDLERASEGRLGLQRPHVGPSYREQPLSRHEEDPFLAGMSGPDVREVPRLGGKTLEQRDVPHLPGSIRLEVSDLADGSDPDPARGVDHQGAGERLVRDPDQPPALAVELENAVLVADVDHPSGVLHDPPVRGAGVVVLRTEGLDERDPGFQGAFPGPRGPANGTSQHQRERQDTHR